MKKTYIGTKGTEIMVYGPNPGTVYPRVEMVSQNEGHIDNCTPQTGGLMVYIKSG